jgi:hypothetical protein
MRVCDGSFYMNVDVHRAAKMQISTVYISYYQFQNIILLRINWNFLFLCADLFFMSYSHHKFCFFSVKYFYTIKIISFLPASN